MIVVVFQVLILAVCYRNANLSYPLVYQGGDDFGVFYYVKTIDKFGISLENPMTGGVTGSNMYDYPYADSLSFFIVKIIGLFTDDVFLITNLFYFICSIIIASTAFFVLAKRIKSKGVAISLALLYANSVFFSMRYGHMWLVPYFMIPIECDIALNILDDKIVDQKKKLYKDRKFWINILLAFLCGFTGLYYAFFACILFFAAFVIEIIKSKKIREHIYSLFFIFSTVLACGLQYIPNLMYLMKNGINNNSEMNVRLIGDAEYYGMKFIQLILPRPSHRIAFLRDLIEKYNANYPSVNENMTSSLGIIATIGFIISFVVLFSTKDNKDIAFLNLVVFMVGTIGGLGSLFSLLIHTPMRSYNRLSLVIMFLSLLMMGEYLDLLFAKLSMISVCIICGLIVFVGIFDQTTTISQSEDMKWEIDDQRLFVEAIDNQLNGNDLVFQYPYVGWPSGGDYKMLVGYIFSNDTRWSFGAMQGREEANWQEKVAAKPIEEMIDDIVNVGYKGLYVDVNIYEALNGVGSFELLKKKLDTYLGVEPIYNGANNLYFWNMNYYIEKTNEIQLQDAA